MSNNSWQKVRFDQICKNVSKRIDVSKGSKYRKFVGLEHLDTLEPKITKWGSTDDVTSSMTLFKNKQILFGRRNWHLRRVAVADFDGLCSGDIYVLEPIKGKIIEGVLPLLMHSDEFFEKNMMYSHGSMSTRVKWSNLAKLEFLIPSISEQENILSITQKIDDVISNIRNLLEKMKNYMISRRELLLTRGIGHTKFKKVKWYYGKTIEIPEEWELKKVSDIAHVSVGLVINPSTYFDVNGTIPMITGKNVTEKGLVLDNVDYISEGSNKLLETTRIWSDDLVTMRVGYPGRTSLVTDEHNGINCASVIITRRNKKYNSNFFSYWANSFSALEQVSFHQGGSGQKVINIGSWNEFIIVFPPLLEQQQIVSILSNINQQITRQQFHLTNLKALRRSILNIKLTKEK